MLGLPLLAGLHLASVPAHAQSPGVTLSAPVFAEGHGTAPPEEGGTNVYNYCAVLDAAPSHDVVVTATPSPTIVTVDAALTFTPSNWSDKQCFSVRAASSADNATDEPDRAVTLSHSSSSSDSGYNGIGIGNYTAVKLRDDDPTIVRIDRTDSGPIYEKAGLDNKAQYTITLGRPLVAGEVATVAHGIGPIILSSDLPGAHRSDRTITLKNGPNVSAPFSVPSGAGVLGVRTSSLHLTEMWIVFYGAGAQTAMLEVTAVEDTLAEGPEVIDVTLDGYSHNYLQVTNVGGGVRNHATDHDFETYIRDTDVPSVMFAGSLPSDSVSEGESATLTLLLSDPLSSSVTIPVTGVSDSATVGEDTPAGPWSATFPAGTTRATLTVPTIDDKTAVEKISAHDAQEYFYLDIDGDALPAGVTLGGPHRAVVAIVDNDKTTVSFTSASSQVNEDAGTVNLTVSIDPPAAGPFWLNFWPTGSAALGTDYEIATPHLTPFSPPHDNWHRVVVPPNVASFDIAVDVIDDSETEDREQLSFQLYSDHSYDLGAVRTPKLWIQDNDGPPSVYFESASSEVQEDAGTASLTVAVVPPPAMPFALNFSLSGTATRGSDYNIAGVTGNSGTVTVPANAGSVTIPVEIIDDKVEDDRETVVVRLLDSGGYEAVTPDSVTLTIRNDEDDGQPPVVVLPAGHPVVKYASLVKSFYDRITARHEHGDSAGGGWNKRFLKAMGHTEYVDYPQAAVTVADATRLWNHGGPGANTAWDGTVEAVTYAEQYFAGTTTPPPAADPEVTITAGDGVTEGASATFTLTADPAPAAPLDVSVTVATDGEYGIAAGEQTVTIPTTGSYVLTLATAGDEADEADGSVSVTVDDGDGYTVGSDSSGSVAIADDDLPPTADPEVTIAAGDGVTEGTSASFTLTADPAPSAPLDVSVTVATDGDYGITAGTQTVTIPTTGSATLTLATAGDEADEADGSVSVTVDAGTGYTVGSDSSGSVAIADDDAPALPAAHPVMKYASLVKSFYDRITARHGHGNGPSGGWNKRFLKAMGHPEYVDYPQAAVTVADATRMWNHGGPGANTAWDGTVEAVTYAEQYFAGTTTPPPASDPEVTIAAGDGVTEGTAATFTLTADPAPTAALDVSVTVATDGDYGITAGTQTVTIPTTGSATLTLATAGDEADEADGSVTATVADGTGYTVASSPANAASVAVADNDAAGLPTLSIDDATGPEGKPMIFTIRLSAPSDKPVHLSLKTRETKPVSARANRDFIAGAYYQVTFRPGQTALRRGFFIRDDSHDDGGETFEVHITWTDAPIADGVAVGTITNADPLPAAYLARFGRTVAVQALDGIAGRMSADRTPGMQGAVAGQTLSFDPAVSGQAATGATPAALDAPEANHAAALALADLARSFGAGGVHPTQGPGPAPGAGSGAGPGIEADPFGDRRFATPSPHPHGMSARDALLGSHFSLTGQSDASGGTMAFWGRAAQARFDGAERGDGTDITLDGEVTTGMLGADYARGDWLIGLALTQSASEGDYGAIGGDGVGPCPETDGDGGLCDGAVRSGDGDVEASLTAAIPYAALQASERLKLWGAAGYGAGRVTLKTAMGDTYEADTRWSMAAAGSRGELLGPSDNGGGPALALTSDALWTRTSSDRTRDLAASDSDTTRLRLGLEGRWKVALDGDGSPAGARGQAGSGASLVPKLEIGVRHDGGDAETGFGVELGGGLAWVDPTLGLSLDVSGRTLIAHESDDLKDRGISAQLAFDPDPATERGPSFSFRQDFGGRAQGGLDALFNPAPLEDRTGSEATSRWTMEAAWGLPVLGGRFTGSPHVGFGLATGARDYSVGWRLAPEGSGAPDLTLGVKATRRESDTQAPEHTVGIEVRARW